VTLAVAGFGRDELGITLKDRQLIARRPTGGKTAEARFCTVALLQRTLVLAEGIEVTWAVLEHGMLSIDLSHPKLETVVRKIDIRTDGDRHRGTSPQGGAL
jgi:HSP20 family molecular chaperone IbpA